MLSAEKVIDLYHIYGFEDGPATEKYLVFYSQQGYFQNAEIVVLDEELNDEYISKEEYEALGYSVRIRRFSSIEQVHDVLFKGFFNVKNSNRKLKMEYDAFLAQQSAKLNNIGYEYINASFTEDGAVKDASIINRIQDLFEAAGGQLVILEASAGYGKTCTSYEVIRSLISHFPDNITILTELSKNRRASIFRYVLLSEIDQKFPTLSYELVKHEISSGRVFLLIDGFDELLSKKYISQDEREKEAQTMLDTIAQLFSAGCETKVLLTTRKSSIFVGEDFDVWVEGHLRDCNITRLQLSEPSLKNWLDNAKIDLLRQRGINLNNIINPVLLALLRSTPLEDFEKNYNSNHDVIMQYLKLLLDRERTRQSLNMDMQEQLKVMENLAAQMVQYDISSESVESIEAILSDIISPDIPEYLERYEFAETKPSKEEFLNKLSHHALLDRLSAQKEQIGFLNDFIFGYMIANAVWNSYLPTEELTGKYLDLAVTSYAAENLDVRHSLYDMIRPSLKKEPVLKQLHAAMLLKGALDGQYRDEYLDSVEFRDGLVISTPLQFQNCIFSGCVFRHCTISVEAFQRCQFYNCSFYDLTIQPGHGLNQELSFYSCQGHDEFKVAACQKVEESPVSIDYERIVLEQFWKPGYENAEPRRADETMLRGISPKDRAAASSAIESLVKKGILTTHLHSFYLNFDKMDEIREIVKR